MHNQTERTVVGSLHRRLSEAAVAVRRGSRRDRTVPFNNGNSNFFRFPLSACPEKILEFEERRAQGKKQNHRKPKPKKSENRAPLKEIDLKLQNLLLDIELESNARQKASLTMEAKSTNGNTVIKVDQMKQNLHLLPTELEGKVERNNVSGRYPMGSRAATTEVIDLLSPSPSVPSRMVSKCQRASVDCIEMIDLSESEIEASPEHAKKARELRLFLASIRQDC
ncbi:hypothetical protein RHGRI_008482 [Rhododendron griersonianum]|uniref:Uncharacterized protein n=1 Tax=Rhododendron griersonianum TaxID=479676 RepID=A0AAV6L3N8_9ERIC|nr:hypothetical protein RHGRI_008482 [Rhododendron griersonianum]